MNEAPLTLQSYQEQARTTDHKQEDFAFPLLGLFGETGSLLSEVKKKQRDTISYVGYAESVLEELGDVLWYLTAVASRAKLSIADMAYDVMRNHADWQRETAPPLPFAELQQHPLSAQDEPTPAFETTLLQLASAVGALVTDHQAGKLENNQTSVANHLIAVFHLLIQAADEDGVTLHDAAKANLEKIFDRWPKDRVYPKPFDDAFPDYKQLPRQLTIEIFERPAGKEGKNFVIQRCNGINIGDRLTDNIMTPDDYRFHDVFHYAYTAILGWSPVTRALFRVKRKSQGRVDEGQDGARAILIEEGVATWIFGQAKALHFFEGMKPGDLSLGLLKTVRQFVAGYEADRCPLWLWEDAILQGYAAFRFLKEHRCGQTHIDMFQRQLTIENLST